MMTVIEKIKPLNDSDQKKYVKELHDNISGLYKAAVKSTSDIHKKYEARTESIQAIVENASAKIEKINQKIEGFNGQRDLLLLEQGKNKISRPIIKIKNHQYLVN